MIALSEDLLVRLRRLKKRIERDRKQRRFRTYYGRFKEYVELLEDVERTWKPESLNRFKFVIPELSDAQMNGLIPNGIHDSTLDGYLSQIREHVDELILNIKKETARSENIERSASYLGAAEKDLERAKSLAKQKDWSGSVEAAQHCIEISIKSLYLLVGLQYPETHDPATELKKVMENLRDLRSNWDYLWREIARMRWICKMWEWIHTSSVYGCLDITANKIFNGKDAKIAIDYAEDVHSNCKQILSLARMRKIETYLTKR
jgi:HEPN domain-containing protein